jgi:hypothetical protein
METRPVSAHHVALGIWMVLGLILMAPLHSQAQAAAAHSAPRLDSVWAANEVDSYGAWKIYLKGSDRDGDLKFIHVWLNVPGTASTPNRLTICADQRSSISGYLVLYSYELGGGPGMLFGSPIRMAVTLEDKAGNRSETSWVAASFYLGVRQASPATGAYEARYLGTVPGGFLVLRARTGI